MMIMHHSTSSTYCNDNKFSDRQVLTNTADADQSFLEEQSDQGLHCLLYHPAGDVLWVFVEPGNVVP